MSVTSWDLPQGFLGVFLSRVPWTCLAHKHVRVCRLLWGELQGKGSYGSVEGRYFISSLISSLFLLTHQHYCPR